MVRIKGKKYGPYKTRKSTFYRNLCIRIDPDLLERVRNFSIVHDVKPSTFIRLAIKLFMDENDIINGWESINPDIMPLIPYKFQDLDLIKSFHKRLNNFKGIDHYIIIKPRPQKKKQKVIKPETIAIDWNDPSFIESRKKEILERFKTKD